MTQTAQISLPGKLAPVFAPPRGSVRYRYAYGGRGSGKSYGFALMAAVWGYAEPLRILCTRDLQNSIKESFHAEVKRAIESIPWLAAAYDVGIDYIRGKNGTEFIFRGLRHNMGAIKSMAGVDLCIIEEAEDVSDASWVDLLPTIRAERSEIWAIWNPRQMGSPVDKRLRQNPPHNAVGCQMNYGDNPWFPSVLEAERLADKERLPDAMYRHIWDGDYLDESDFALIPYGMVREAFDRNIGYHYAEKVMGVDVGMSLTGDPSAIVLRQGGAITHLEELRLTDSIAIAGKVKERCGQLQPHSIVVDAIGWGAGVAHILSGWGLPVVAMNVGERAAESDRFINARAELWWRLRDFFADKQCSIHASDLRDKLAIELSQPQYSYTPAGKIQLESKDSMKKRGIESPNLADALSLTMHIRPALNAPDTIYHDAVEIRSVFC